MKSIKRGVIYVVLAIVIIAAGGITWFIGSHTVICTEKEYVFAQKEKFAFEKNYVDVRQWTILDYISNPEIAQALIANGYKELQEEMDKSEVNAKTNEVLNKKIGRAHV